MITIAISQNVTWLPDRQERIDSLDQQWTSLLLQAGIRPLIIPNNIEYIDSFLRNNSCKGIVLTGGNSLVKYGGHSSERDACEQHLLSWAIKEEKPVWAVCRGMQLVQDYFDIPLEPVTGYIKKYLKPEFSPCSSISRFCSTHKQIQTFFTYATSKNKSPLIVTAKTYNNIILALEHRKLAIYCQMWHSERLSPFSLADIDMIKTIFTGNNHTK